MADKCFACDKGLGENPALIQTLDGQTVYVGRECFSLIKRAGEHGYQPPKGGPRLYLIPECDCERPDPVAGVALISNGCPYHG